MLDGSVHGVPDPLGIFNLTWTRIVDEIPTLKLTGTRVVTLTSLKHSGVWSLGQIPGFQTLGNELEVFVALSGLIRESAGWVFKE